MTRGTNRKFLEQGKSEAAVAVPNPFFPMQMALGNAAGMNLNAIKGYRVKGGAVIRVFRGDRVRRYRVSVRRFCALRLRFAGAFGWHGFFGNCTLDIHTKQPACA